MNRRKLSLLWAAPLPVWVLAVAVAAEATLVVFRQAILGPYLTPLTYWVLSAGIGLYPLWYAWKGKMPEAYPPYRDDRMRRWVGYGVFFFAAAGLSLLFARLLEADPITLAKSDVLPITKVYLRRLLEGENVYSPYFGFGYRFDPTHLPLQWLPYLPAELLGIDYRWVSWVVLLPGLALYQQVLLSRRDLGAIWLIFLTLLPFLILWDLTRSHRDYDTRVMLTQSQELLDAGYYLILGFALYRGAIWLRSTGLLLTLLSRFSLLLWLPAALLAAWRGEGTRKTLLTGALVLAGILLLYVLPFLSQDWQAFSRGQAHYTRATLAEWSPPPEVGLPYPMQAGLGMSVFVWKYAPGEMADKVQLGRFLHLGMSLLATLLCAGGFFFFRSRVSIRLFLVCSLKFYLAFFYAFVQIPYPSLYLVPLFFSLIVLAVAGEK